MDCLIERGLVLYLALCWVMVLAVAAVVMLPFLIIESFGRDWSNE